MKRKSSKKTSFTSIVVAVVLVIVAFNVLFGQKDDTTAASAPTTSTQSPTYVPDLTPSAEPTEAVETPEPTMTEEPAEATPEEIPAYDRDLFGGWADPDGNGCRARDDILARDLTQVTTADGCKVLTGTLADPYTGKTIDFTFGAQSSQAVQIDHIVSLSAAWQGGAWNWDEDTRVSLANDPENLLAVDGPANNKKSDRGPSSWMPSNAGNPSYDCDYAAAYQHILDKYDLDADPQDITALNRTLAGC